MHTGSVDEANLQAETPPGSRAIKPRLRAIARELNFFFFFDSSLPTSVGFFFQILSLSRLFDSRVKFSFLILSDF